MRFPALIFVLALLGGNNFTYAVPSCLDLFADQSKTPLRMRPYGIARPMRLEPRTSLVPSIALVDVETVFGKLRLRESTYADLRDVLYFYGRNEEGIGLFISGIFNGTQNAPFATPDFLQWIVAGHASAVYAENGSYPPINLSDLLSTTAAAPPKTNNVVSLFGPKQPRVDPSTRLGQTMLGQLRGENQIFQQARAGGGISPLRFRSFGPDRERNYHPMLSDHEAVWLFRILTREPLLRALLRSKPQFGVLSSADFRETLFFVSAFPELIDLAAEIQELGFEFRKYSLTDGFYTTGDRRFLFSRGTVELEGILSLEKNIGPTSESLDATISVRDKTTEIFDDEMEPVFRLYVRERWGQFLAEHPEWRGARLATRVDDDLGLGFEMEVVAPVDVQALIVSRFFLDLVHSPKRVSDSP